VFRCRSRRESLFADFFLLFSLFVPLFVSFPAHTLQVSHTNIGNAAYRPTYTFKTAKEAGDETPYTIAVTADLGLMGEDGLSTRTAPFGGSAHSALEANETNTIQVRLRHPISFFLFSSFLSSTADRLPLQSLLALKDTYDFLIHVGDIGYADYFLRASVEGYYGTADDETQPTREEVAEGYESMSETFFDQTQLISSSKPWMVSPGNHEANCECVLFSLFLALSSG
jgi:hypothetical protein